MIARPPLPPGPFLVVGLARSGVAAALALRARGGEVAGCDARAVGEDVRARLEAAGVPVRAPSEGVELLAGVSTVVKSPGVPQEAPVVATARRQGIRIVGELEIGWRLVLKELLAVTGSNGKTTTVELVGHVHRTAGRPVVVAGNVGTPLTELPGSVEPGAVVVCEASSFQLEDTEAFAPEAAVLLNLAEDHLDRHGSLEAYRAAKLQAFARQPPDALAVAPAALAADLGGMAARITFGRSTSDPGGRGGRVESGRSATDPGGRAGRVESGRSATDPGGRGGLVPRPGATPDLADHDGELRWRGEPLMPAAEIGLRGAHNRENAMAAAALCLARGLPADAVRAGLASFKGVAHRLEEVATAGGVLYVNDSKATNVASAVVGIESFPGGVHAILGGRGKGGDYTPLAAPVAARCRAAYLIGETAAELHEALVPTGVELHDCGDLEGAMAAARRAARAGDVVLLSPACASFDQYESFEQRGEHFRALAREG